MANEIEIVIKARDQASAALAKFQGEVEGAAKGSTAAMGQLAVSIRGSGEALERVHARGAGVVTGLRQIAGTVLSELNPALGQAATQAAGATAGMARFAGALGPVGAAVAVASAALVPYINNLRESTEKQASMNLAAQAFDAGALRGQLLSVAKDMETMRLRSESFVGSGLNLFRMMTDALGWTTKATEDLGRAQDLLRRVLPLERTEGLTKLQLEQLGIQRDLIAVETERAQRFNDLDAFVAANRQLTSSLEQQEILERKLIQLEAQRARASAEAINEPPEAIAAITAREQAALANVNRRSRVRADVLAEMNRRGLAGISERLLPKADPSAGVMGLGGLQMSPEEEAAVSALGRQGDERQLQLAVELARVRGEEAGLSDRQRLTLTLQTVEAEKQLALFKAQGSVGEQLLATETARAKTQAELRAYAEKHDPLAGLDKFVREQTAEAEAFGDMMYNVGRAGQQALQQGLSQGLGDLLLGEMKKGVDYGKVFAQALVRGISNELAGRASSAIFANLGRMFESVAGSSPVRSVLGMLGIGGAAGAAALPVGAYAATGGGAVLIAGRYLPMADVAVAQAQAGPAGVQALARGEAIVSGGQLIGGGAELITAGVVPSVGTTSRALTGGQWLGLGTTAAAYGLSLYGAYNNTTTTTGVITNTVLGAIMGGAAGYQYGGDASSALIGAIVAGLGSLITSLAGKAKADEEARAARQAAEVQRAVGAARDLVSEAHGARSLQDFFAALTAFGSGYTGGTRNPAVITTVETPTGARPIGTIGNAATMDDLFAALDTLQANIQAGVAPDQLAAANAQASLALRERGRQLLDEYQSRIGAVDVFAERGIGGDLQRRTTVPATRASTLSGEDLYISQVGLAGLNDDDKELLLRDMMRIAAGRGIRAFTKDLETEQIVSITDLFGSSGGGTGGGGGGGTGGSGGTGGTGTGTGGTTTPGLESEINRITQEIRGIPAFPRDPVLSSYDASAFGGEGGQGQSYYSSLVQNYNARRAAYYEEQVGRILDAVDPAFRAEIERRLAAAATPTDAIPSPGETGPGALGAPAGQTFSQGARAFTGLTFSQSAGISLVGSILGALLGMPMGITPLSPLTSAIGLEKALEFFVERAPNLASAVGLFSPSHALSPSVAAAFGAQRAGERGVDLSNLQATVAELAEIEQSMTGMAPAPSVASALAAAGFPQAEAAPAGMLNLMLQYQALGLDPSAAVSQGMPSGNADVEGQAP